jgi:hypothetical protein
MEADWEVEVGPGTPVIDALWPGFVDLRSAPQQAHTFPEVAQLPPLAAVLARLNALASPVWTSRCDVWPLEDFDPDEMDASRDVALHALACYIDLLPASRGQWPQLALAVDWCKRLCSRLRTVPLRSCRADCIVRSTVIDPGRSGFGLTAYLSAAASDPAAAAGTLASALAVFADAILLVEPPEMPGSKLQ